MTHREPTRKFPTGGNRGLRGMPVKGVCKRPVDKTAYITADVSALGCGLPLFRGSVPLRHENLRAVLSFVLARGNPRMFTPK
ncbi:hypothetical protein CFR74_04660 [Novacetimonas hansenii]|nr:hypothetical protein CFR74_04660 [Novacetimonas hansenii]